VNDAANPTEYGVDARSSVVEVDVCAPLGRQNAATQIRPQREWSKLLEVVVDTACTAKRIGCVGPGVGLVRGRWQRRRNNIAQPVNGKHAINAELCVSGGGTDKGNGGKKENCFAETHVPLVY